MLRTDERELDAALGPLFAPAEEGKHDAGRVVCVDERVEGQLEPCRKRLRHSRIRGRLEGLGCSWAPEHKSAAEGGDNRLLGTNGL